MFFENKFFWNPWFVGMLRVSLKSIVLPIVGDGARGYSIV